MFDPSEVIGGRRNRRHNLNMVDGKASMFYAGEVPWHTLGTRLDGPATAAEAIEAANLGFEVGTFPVQIATAGGDPKFEDLDGLGVPMGFAVVRLDTKAVLGCVGPRWKPVQNRQGFGFLDAVAAERKLEYHTAGAIGMGERVWMLAKMPGVIAVGQSDDTVEKYLLLSNAHNGLGCLRVLWTPQRVVCQNTLAVALAGAEGEGIAIRHTGDLQSKVREAQRVLGLAERFYDEELTPRINRLAGFSPTQSMLDNYFKTLYPDPDDPQNHPRAAVHAEEVRGVLHDLFETGIGHDQPGVRGTLWAAYNSVTEYVDHDKPIRGESKLTAEGAASRKLESMWWGQGAAIKREAWSNACILAECV
jgi:phage/plasmid-like protein (TIGR03299 family)